MKVSVLIAAAGRGERACQGQNKLFTKMGAHTVLHQTVSAFYAHEKVDEIAVAVNPAEEKKVNEILQGVKENFARKIPLFTVKGGDTRTQTVKNGLAALHGDIVMIHDGARPFVSENLISRCILQTEKVGSALPAIPPTDTIWGSSPTGVTPLNRNSLLAVQTPQCFLLKDIRNAYACVGAESYTDDAAVYAKFFDTPHLMKGEEENKKLTYPQDFCFAQNGRVGVGYDTHRLVENRKLILGGVEIPHTKGLLGHSDADALCHAIMDALLSAAALPDIGHLFPDTDPKYEGANSANLLSEVVRLVEEKGFRAVNVSAVICAQKPKLAPYLDKIIHNLAKLIHISTSHVGITCTTTEGLGFIGREEGIACHASVLLART